MDEVDKLLEKLERSRVRVKTAADYIPKTVPFTQGAFKKADMIGPLVKDLTKQNLEWSAFLLAQKGDPRYLVRDIFIQKGQKIDGGHVEVNGEDVAAASVQIGEENRKRKKQLYAIGWIHGHGTYELVPSSVDRKNFQLVTNSVSLNTEQKINSPLSLIEENPKFKESARAITYSGAAMEDAIITHSLPPIENLEAILNSCGVLLKDNDKLDAIARRIITSTKTDYFQPNIFGFSYFVIMNNLHQEPYTGIELTSEKAITRAKYSDLIEKVGISRVNVEDDIEVDEGRLKDEIKENMDYPWSAAGKIWSFLTGLDSGPIDTGSSWAWRGSGYIQGAYIPGEAINAIKDRAKEYAMAGDLDKAKELQSVLRLLKDVEHTYTKRGALAAVDRFFSIS
jgi:hypothetical protein